MLDQLTSLVKEVTGQAVSNTPEVANEQSDAIAQEATGSIVDELKNAISGGGLSGIVNIFTGKETDVAAQPAIQNILGSVTGKLKEKFGMSDASAQSLSASIVPSVLSKLTGKINDPNDSSFNLDNTISSLTGGKLANISSILDKNGDGKLDLSDLTSLLGQQGQGDTNGGGILGKITGLFK